MALIAALTIGGCPDSSSDSTGDPESRVAQDGTERPNGETPAASSDVENPLDSVRRDVGTNSENAPRDPASAGNPEPGESRSSDPSGDTPESGQGDGPEEPVVGPPPETDPTPPVEICDDGIDNDGDGLIDCEDPDCFGDPACPSGDPPEIRCPDDLTVECDGAGNPRELRAWLNSVRVRSACRDLRVTNDFTGLSDDCGATGSATVTWVAVDSCGRATCSATFTIVDTAPPMIRGPRDVIVECDGSGNAEELRRWLGSATAEDACGNARLSNDFSGLSDDCGETGAATVTWTASDECRNTSTHTATFTIIDTTPPVITLIGNAMITLECHVDPYVEQGASVADACDPGLRRAVVGGDPVDPNTVGVYVVTYDATDACGNRAEQVTRVVEVVDTIPPEVTVGPMVLLWPPNHEYRTLNLSDCVESVFDLCEGTLDVNEVGTILSIYSDEPEDARGGGDGHTLNDIVMVGNSSFMVRAERQGGGNGRVYGITFQVVDASGNITETISFVGVPHDQSGGLPIDDGPESGYTVP